MNKYWIILMGIGLFFLLSSASWEIYQNNQGYRSQFNKVVVEYEHDYLLAPLISKQLAQDPNYILYSNSSSSSSSTSSTLN